MTSENIKILTPQNCKISCNKADNSDYSVISKSTYKIFLAGPINGNLYWRNQFIKDFLTAYGNEDIDGYISFFNPQGDSDENTFKQKMDHQYQVEWETATLALSDIIVFCIPAPQSSIENYARTTRFELGEWIAKASYYPNKHIFIWMHNDFPGREYIKQRALNSIYLNISDLHSGNVHLFNVYDELVMELMHCIKIKYYSSHPFDIVDYTQKYCQTPLLPYQKQILNNLYALKNMKSFYTNMNMREGDKNE